MTGLSRKGRVIRRLVRVSCARPWWTVVLALAVAVVSLVYTVTTLGLKTAMRDLLPQGLPYVERYTQYDREFGELDDLAIVVEAPSLPEAKEYATRLVRELKTDRVPIRRIAYRIDPKQFEGRGLLYLSTERLAEIRDKVFDYQEFMEAFASRPTLDQLVEGISSQVASGFAAGFLDLKLEQSKGAPDLRFIKSLVGQISERLDKPTPYRSPWGALFTVSEGDESGAGYFLSDDQRFLFILVEPEAKENSFTSDRDTIEGIRGSITTLRKEFPTVNVGVTGKPALASDEMTAAFRDSERATLVAFALTLGLLLLAYLRVGKPVIMLLVLTASLAWSMGAVTLVIGHLSLFSIMFISIVIGIGIDYGIYFLFRYEEEIFLGRSLREAIEITAARTGPGMLMGAVTAAATFYVLMLTDFRGLQELGFVSGTAILLAWLGTMTVFPAALVIVDRRHADRPGGAIPRAIKLESIHVPYVDQITRHPRVVLALVVLVTIASLWGLRSVHFDYNLLNLQAEGTESVAWEKRIIASAGRSGFSALASAGSLQELRNKHEAFRRLPSVSEVDSALLLIPDRQDEKLKIIADFAALVGPIKVGRPLPVDVGRLQTAFETLRRRLAIAAAEAPPGDVQRELARVTADIDRLLVKLRQTDPEMSEPVLNNLQRQLYRDFVRNFQRLQANLSPRPIGLADVPPELRRKFISDKGHFLLQIHPAVNIWERDGARRFVAELRGIDPDVTGTPVITYETINLMERAYKQGTIYAVVLVAVVSLLVFRRARETALALLPLGLGLAWTVGLMYVFNLSFTMGNIFGLPLIIGAAAEYGINILLRYIEGRDHGGPLLPRSTVMAVLVAGLTTIVGFGSLMLADHRGIFGLGLLLTLGTLSSLIASLVVLPVLLGINRPRGAPSIPRPVEQPTPTPATVG